MELEAYKSLRKEFLARHKYCEWCLKCLPWNPGKSVDVHHSRGRSGSLLLDVRYWIAVCRFHHSLIHNDPEQARKKGFLCEKGKWGSSK